MPDQNLENRIAKLEKQMQSLNQSSTITYQVDNALQGRGFLKNTVLIAGKGTMSGAGEFIVGVSGATANSVVVTSCSIAGVAISAVIRESPTSPGSYEVFAEGPGSTDFDYIVYLTNSLYTT